MKPERLIFKCEFGSKVYGTSVPTSDQDFKSVFIPNPEDILLQRAPKSIQRNTKFDGRAKNSAEDIDYEGFSIQHYLKLLCEGQTVALDTLFCPKEHVLYTSDTWNLILENKEKFLHKGTSAFVGYTKAQAAKYGVKGFRVAALKSILEFLSNLPVELKLQACGFELAAFCAGKEHMAVVLSKGPNGKDELHLEVCGRKIPFHASVEYALTVFQKIYDNYGQRALLAEKNEGIDWKALLHAVRVAHEAEELLLTHKITFPRPERELLLKIRKIELPYKQVAEIIEEGLERVAKAQAISTLPEKPDLQLAEDLVYHIHKEEVHLHISNTL